MSARDVRIHIEELVLEGFSPGDRTRIADGLGAELERLVAENVPPQWTRARKIECLRVSTVHLAAAAAAERIGEKVATALYGATKEPLR